MPRAPRYPEPFVRTVRAALRTPPGRTLGRALYRVAAEGAARALMGVPGVESVYAGGSYRRPEAIVPGHSDLDLFVLVRPLTDVRAHRALRDALDLRMRALERVFPAIQTMDYLDVSTLPIVRAHGNDFGRSIDARLVHLAGARHLDAARHPPARVPIFDLALALRRWTKAAAFALGWSLDPFERVRVARKLFVDVVAGCTGRDRLDPFDDVLTAARAIPGARAHGDVFDAIARGPDEAGARTRALLAGALVVLEAFADEHHGDFEASDRARSAPATRDAPDVADEDAARRLAAEVGAADAWIVRSAARSRGRHVVVRLHAEEDASRVVTRMETFAQRAARTAAGFEPHPVFLTPALLRASALLDPYPFAGRALAARLHEAPGPRALRGELARSLMIARVVAGTWRIPSLRFHARGSTSLARQAAARELTSLGCVLDELEGASMDAKPSEVHIGDEAALVDAIHRYHARVRGIVR